MTSINYLRLSMVLATDWTVGPIEALLVNQKKVTWPIRTFLIGWLKAALLQAEKAQLKCMYSIVYQGYERVKTIFKGRNQNGRPKFIESAKKVQNWTVFKFIGILYFLSSIEFREHTLTNVLNGQNNSNYN